MAKKTHNEVAVGITVLVVLALTFYIVVMLADWSDLRTPKKEITVQLPYKTGLRGLLCDSPIYLGGAKVGRVTETRIDNLAPNAENSQEVYAFFTMEIPCKYPLRSDCVLMPNSNVLGGQTMLDIEDLGREGEIIKDGATVRLTLGESFVEAVKREIDPDNPDSLLARLKFEANRDNNASIMASLVRTALNLKQITTKLDAQLSHDQQKLTLMAKVHTILDNLSIIAERVDVQLDTDNKQAVIAKLLVSLDKLDRSLSEIKDTISVNRPGITSMVTSLKNTAEQLEKDLPLITGQIKQTFAKVDASVDIAKVALLNLKDFSRHARDTILVNRDNIDQLINNVTQVSVNLKLASRDIRRAPWKLLYKPKKDELKIQGLVDSAGAFASGAERLDNAALRLRTILSASGNELLIDREKIDSIIAELETSFERYSKAEKKFWDELKP